MPTRPPISRRELLALLGAAGLTGLRLPAQPPTPAPLAARRFAQWGVQLYTVRDVAQANLDSTLAALAGIGYREVETHSYYGRSAADFRKALDAAGLTAPSAHVGINALETGLPALLETCATIGHRWLVVPSLPGSLRTPDGYKRVGETLGRAAEAARSAAVRIAYHNHDIDFAPVAGSTGMDLILQSAPREVTAELDVYWIVKAGHDPYAFLTKYSGRVTMLHLKDAGPDPERAMLDVGAGTIDWARLLPAARGAGVQHVFVEHDRPGDSLASVRASYTHLSRLGVLNGRE